MALKTFRPLTPSLRFTELNGFEEITKGNAPVRKLPERLKKTGGRNSYGRLTSRHIGGGHKQRYRFIDFKRDRYGIKAVVESIEYDPIRTARIALLKYTDGERRYIIAPVGLAVGTTLCSGPEAEPIPGNALPLANIPLGTVIHNIELRPGEGGKLVRSAGSSAQLMAKEGAYAQVRMPSGEVRKIQVVCRATIGQLGNLDHENEVIGKAGRSRHLGKRPSVRGIAMNPVDHPHGGGEARSTSGRPPTTPWGQMTMGKKTRRNKRTANMIVRKRKGK